tara:strand:- start:425 stop:598 length:174 start_codon:yes stop_codon:yes gene_type:complete
MYTPMQQSNQKLSNLIKTTPHEADRAAQSVESTLAKRIKQKIARSQAKREIQEHHWS